MSAPLASTVMNFALERMPTLQFVLLLLGHSPHQSFIIFCPETLGTEQHHVSANAALDSDKVLDDHLSVININDIRRKVAHQRQKWKTMYGEVFGFTDRTLHQPKLGKLLFDLYQEGLTPPQVNHVQSSRFPGMGRVLRSTSRSVRYSDPRNRRTAQPGRSTFLRLLAKTGRCDILPDVAHCW